MNKTQQNIAISLKDRTRTYGDMTLVAEITSLFVEEKTDGTVGDQTPVLHGSRLKIRDSDEVHLGKGVSDAKEFRKVLQRKRRDRKRKLGLFSLSRKNINTAGNRLRQVLGHGLNVFKLANNEGNQL